MNVNELDFSALIDADIAYLSAEKDEHNTIADCVHAAIAAYLTSFEEHE